MAGNLVQMDYERIQFVSNGFKVAQGIVTAIWAIAYAQLEVMKMSAFMAPPIVAKLTEWQQNIREKGTKLAETCGEFSQDLAQAINDHKKGDVAGKKYFMKGIRL
jgi:hypothetical protein